MQHLRPLPPLANTDRALQVPLDWLRDITGGARASLFLKDPQTGEAVTRVAHLPEIEEIRLPPGEGIVGAVLRHGQPMAWPGNAPAPAQTVTDITGFTPTSILAWPVRLEGRVVGVLELMNAPTNLANRQHLARATEAMERILHFSSLAQQLVPLRDHPGRLAYRFEGLIGASPQMERLFQQAQRLVALDTPVLLTGETGTGKELLARTIHANSSRAHALFVKVDCRSLPDVLLAMELFGHVEGAFTGNSQPTRGAVLAATGGTLFLEEVGALPNWIGELLRQLITEEVVVPLGGDTPQPTDVRIIASTCRNLEAREEADFLRYLEGFTLNLPPLRERGADDILRLLDHFVALYGRRYGITVNRIPENAQQALTAYRWPGNVDELSQQVETAICGQEDGELDIGLFSLDRQFQQGPFDDLPRLEELEARYVAYLMERTGGHKAEIARILDIGRTTLWRKLRDLGYE